MVASSDWTSPSRCWISPITAILTLMSVSSTKIWAGLWGALLHRNHEVYSYIAESLERFPDRSHLRDIFRGKGFSVIDSRLFFGGVTELLVVQKLQSGEAL